MYKLLREVLLMVKILNRNKVLLGLLVVLTVVISACSGENGKTLKPNDVLQAFEDAGLAVGEDAREMTEEDYGMIPKSDDDIILTMSSLGEDVEVRILYYEDEVLLNNTRDHYEMMEEDMGMPSSHVFKKDNVLVQIKGDFSDEEAKEFEKVLSTIN